MKDELFYDYLLYLLKQSRFVEIKMKGDFHPCEYNVLIDRFHDWDLHEVTVDVSPSFYEMKEVKISFRQVIE